MEILFNFLLIFAWTIFSIYEGKREAWYFHERYKMVHDIHFYFSIQRISVGFAFLIALTGLEISWLNLLDLALTSTMMITMFVFLHDGYYYQERNNLNPTIYKKRFKDYNDSSAIFDFTWNERKIMLIVGVLIMICKIIYL